MNDDVRLERLFDDGLHGLAPKRAPDRLRTQVKTESSRVRPRPRWLALIKEPPMRTNSRLAVGSPTARAAAIMVATLLAALMLVSASIAGAQLFAADGPIVVDQTGEGTTTTITEAVAMAEDGDEILVRPGTYTEAVLIEAEITVRGDGPVEDIVVMAPDDGPEALISPDWNGNEPYSFQLLETNATLADMTISGTRSAVHATGGSPTISGLVLEGVGEPYRGGGNPGGNGILVNSGSTATISGNVLDGGGPIGMFDKSDPLIEGNTLVDGPHIWGGFGDGTVIRGNTISGPFIRGIGLFDKGSPLIEGNTITDSNQNGIDLDETDAPVVSGNVISGSRGTAISVNDSAATVSGNTLLDNGNGINAYRGSPTLSGNTLTDNNVGISGAGDSGRAEGNTIAGGTTAIVIAHGSPTFDGNTVTDASNRGFAIGGSSSPTLSGNTVCDNGENVWVAEAAEPVIDDSNEIC